MHWNMLYCDGNWFSSVVSFSFFRSSISINSGTCSTPVLFVVGLQRSLYKCFSWAMNRVFFIWCFFFPTSVTLYRSTIVALLFKWQKPIFVCVVLAYYLLLLFLLIPNGFQTSMLCPSFQILNFMQLMLGFEQCPYNWASFGAFVAVFRTGVDVRPSFYQTTAR